MFSSARISETLRPIKNCQVARTMTSLMDKYVDYWRRRGAEQKRHSQRLAKQARSDLERIVTALVGEFGASRIILFGSLVRGRFAPGSDMDLAVEGIPPGDFFAALALVNRLASLRVDLKPLEDLEPHFRRRVIATGEVIYARDVQQ